MKRLLISVFLFATAAAQTSDTQTALVLPMSFLRHRAELNDSFAFMFGAIDSPTGHAYFEGKKAAYDELIVMLNSAQPPRSGPSLPRVE